MVAASSAPAKISPPRPTGVYARQRLFGTLDAFPGRSAAWIVGPPGAGKTTLAASYLDARNVQAVWYTVDAGDQDPATFFHYLRLAATEVDATRGRRVPAFTPEYALGLPVFTRRFFEALYGLHSEAFVLVLDDYQEVPTPSVFHQIVANAIESLPDAGRVLVLSREPPPADLARLKANQVISEIGPDALKLDEAELKGILGLRDPTPPGVDTESLLERTDGWLAGLMLLLASDQLTNGSARHGAEPPQEVFDYFAKEIFESQGPSVRSLLMHLSLLPRASQRMAVDLTDTEEAGALLDEWSRSNYFVTRHEHPEVLYQFHPMFRHFLLHRLGQSNPARALADLRRRAGRVLESHGHMEAAVEAYYEAGAVEPCGELVCRLAPELVAQGRIGTVEHWIARLEPPIVAAQPWLCYWLAASRVFTRPDAAQAGFEAAYAGFRRASDPTGSCLAWAGVVDAVLTMAMADVRPLDPWLDQGWSLLKTAVPRVSAEVESRLVTALCTALLFRRPDHPELPALGERVRHMIERSTDDGFKFQASMFMVHLFHGWRGEADAAQPLVDAMQPVVVDDAKPTAHRLQGLVARASHDWLNGRTDRVFEAVELGEGLSSASGLTVFDFHLRGMGIFAALDAGDTDRARAYIETAEGMYGEHQHLRQSFVSLCKAWEAWRSGRLNDAEKHLASADHHVGRSGDPLFMRASVDLSAAIVALDRNEDAGDPLEAARRSAQAMDSAFLAYRCRLIDADRALVDGATDLCASALGAAFSTARKHQLYTTYWWDPEVASRLCDFALQHDIEPEYVQELIRRQALEPPPHCSECWPWPIRIYGLGGFRLLIDGEPAPATALRKRKVIELLQLLAVSDNATVAEIADALWPDSDGDAGQVALKTNVHRLRGVLGRSDAVIQAHGHVRLNVRVCWCDIAAFEGLTDELARRGAIDDVLVRRALELYRGPLLGMESEELWSLAPAERLRQRFLRLIHSLGERLEAAERWSEAIDLYERALVHHEAEEGLYQALTQCLHRAGRSAEAAAAYERCRAALAAHGGAPTELRRR